MSLDLEIFLHPSESFIDIYNQEFISCSGIIRSFDLVVKDNCSGFHAFLAYGTLTGRVDYVKLSSSFSNIKFKAGGAL